MDSSIVTAGAALAGSLVGALASLGSTFFTQRTLGRRDHLARQFLRRESLYSDFIIEAARLYSEALSNNLMKAEGMAKIWGLVSRIRLSASEPLVSAAEQVMTAIAEQFVADNLSLAEIRELARLGDPLKGFGDAARVELEALDRES